jgi:uncharacterized protein YifN (PemK superfamily)
VDAKSKRAVPEEAIRAFGLQTTAGIVFALEMPIQRHPETGTIVLCDFNTGFKPPEMVKRRPALVISPPMRRRPGLCTVVPLSTKAPDPLLDHHIELLVEPRLPAPWDSPTMWVKADMIYAAGFHRLDLIRGGRDASGRRQYRIQRISDEQLKAVRACVLCGLGLRRLTSHL